MLGRRDFLGGLLSIYWIGRSVAHGRPLDAHGGCIWNDETLSRFGVADKETLLSLTGREPIITRSGDAPFDRALAVTLSHISDTFGVLPGFGYFDEPLDEGPNAYAIPLARMANPDGTVLFGRRLLRETQALPERPAISVGAICAHEWGHILQYKRGLKETLLAGSRTVKPMELHADFLAGYYAGSRKLKNPNYPAAVVALTQFNTGDTAFNDPAHHGTREERGRAVVAGFNAAYRMRSPLNEAVGIGIEHARGAS